MLSTLKGFFHRRLHNTHLMVHTSARVTLRHSTRLSNSRNIILTRTHATSFLETENSSILSQRREIASAANIHVVDHESMELDPSALDMMSHEQVRQGLKTRRKVKNKKRSFSQIDAEVNDQDEEFVPDKKPRRRQAPKPEPVYVIPDVERKETTFKGRLGSYHLLSFMWTYPCAGYACLNTVLRNKKPASDSIFCSRTCRYV